VDANANDATLLTSLFSCLRLIMRVFYSLNSQELPEVFEDAMDAWMGQFHKYLASY
jgi:exportin-2 (importin alpha re-exporter)